MDFKTEYLAQYISYLWIIILAATIWAWLYVRKQEKDDNIMVKRHWIEMLPSCISTLGVLGTFGGITLGLLWFKTDDLTSSIPQLLEGLKTAFLTSIAGMIGSLILSRKINNLYDKATSGVSDINQAAGLICQSVADFQQASSLQAQNQLVFYNLMQTLVQNLDTNITSVNANINALNVSSNNIALDINNLLAVINTIETNSTTLIEHVAQMIAGMVGIGTTVSNTLTSVGNIEGKLDSHASIYNEISNDIKHLDENSASINADVNILKTQLKDGIGNMENITSSIVASVGNIEEQLNSNLSTCREISGNIGEMLDHTEAIVSTEGEVSEKITTLTTKLHGEVVDIEDKMQETNKLLEIKFNEFSELLKKSNTEALVKVMENVTKEFQTQMNALISRLVKENFEQLNNSVERLNHWQTENKEMIKSLTNQYLQMANNFEGTSKTLTKVKEDTQTLVSDGGKLDQLVKSLNEVIVKDEKFKEISSNLQRTSDIAKTNMDSFDQSTQRLNEWVKKQRNFMDSVDILISKLEEIKAMKDYASTFWKETKDGMNEAVGIIKDGSKQLNEQLSGLDQQFYTRLSTTLAQLDACIQSLITNAPSKSNKSNK